MLCAMNIVNVQPAATQVKSCVNSKQSTIQEGPTLSGPETAGITTGEKSVATCETSVPESNTLLGDWVPGEMKEDTTLLFASSTPPFESDSIAGRRKHFQSQKARKSLVFTPDNVYNFEVILLWTDSKKRFLRPLLISTRLISHSESM